MGKPDPRLRVGHEFGRSTVLTLVLFATYLGIGALAHDSRFSLVGARQHAAGLGRPGADHPYFDAGSGATAVQAAIAVTVGAIGCFRWWCRYCR